MNTSVLLTYVLLFSIAMGKETLNIIQWNCRGLKANYNEILLLQNKYSPTVFCIQETFLKQSDSISLKGFNEYHYIFEGGEKSSGGASIFVKSSVPQRQIQLKSSLQAVAVSLTLHKVITVCSVYLPPSAKLSKSELDNLSHELPEPFIILGDMNGHHSLWGCSDRNERGEILEDFISSNDLCLLMIKHILTFIQHQVHFHL